MAFALDELQIQLTAVAKSEIVLEEIVNSLAEQAYTARELERQTAAAREALREIERRIQDAENYAQDHDLLASDIKAQITKHANIAKNFRQELRRAMIKSRTLSMHRAENERKQLFAGAKDREQANAARKTYDTKNLVEQSKNMTSKLESIKKLLEPQIKQSQAVGEKLKTSSEELSAAVTHNIEYAGQITKSRSLFSKLKSRELTDKILTAVGFLFFLCCVLYVLHKRLPFAMNPYRWIFSDYSDVDMLHDHSHDHDHELIHDHDHSHGHSHDHSHASVLDFGFDAGSDL